MITYTLPPGLQETRFPEGGIWYKTDGRYLRSVSKILNRIYPLPPDLPQWYLTRGQMVHSATVLIDMGSLDWEGLDKRLLPFCEAYRDFIETAHPVMEATELVVVAQDLYYGGRLDRVVRLPARERLLVTDIKCGMGREDRYWLQCAGLASALAGDQAGDYDLALLNLDNKGNPHFTVENNPAPWIAKWGEILEKDRAAA